MNLAKEISFLLFKHHCVILPSFGAFLINKKDAERSVESKFALPKKEIVSFNRQITQNDGLLANHISVSLGCTYNDGLAIAEQYVEDLWGQLHTKKNIEIAEVGTFYYTQDEKLIFVPYHSVNFATASYGLPKLRLTKLSDLHPSKQVAVAKPAKIITQEKMAITATTSPLEEVPVLEQKRRENKRRLEDLQAKKLEKQNKTKTPRKRNRLTWVNTLGALVLIAMGVALVGIDQQSHLSQDTNMASLLDTPSTANISAYAEVSKGAYSIYATTNSLEEATALYNSIKETYSEASIQNNNNETNEVHIISFNDSDVASEYHNLIENKIDQKLVLKLQ